MTFGELRAESSSVFSFADFYDSILALIYPQACRICGKSVESRANGFACRQCWQTTKILTGNETLCSKCGAFLRVQNSQSETFCHCCDEYFFDVARSIGKYEKALLISILNLKREAYIPKILEEMLCRAFFNSPFADSTVIVPVPLSNKRMSERGFNQALLIAETVAKCAKLPVDSQSLIRCLQTPKDRAGMDRKARAETVKNAFKVQSPRLIEGARILLVDDVLTTGATVSSAAESLKKAGAEKVYVLTLARAV